MEQSFAEKLEDFIRIPEPRYRPDVRWWLAEGLNTDETLRKNVREIYDSGFGAAEFLAMPEPGADSAVYGWGSDEWTSDTRLIIGETTKLGLGFSLTSGSHWANANLPDTYTWWGEPYHPDNKAASQELDYVTILLKAGEGFDGTLPLPVKVGKLASDAHGTSATYRRHCLAGVVAAKLISPREGSGQEFGYAQGTGTGVLDFNSLTDLTSEVSGTGESRALRWAAPRDGDYALFVYWMHGTGQTASPSVSTNYTINYVDRYGVQALIDYWEDEVLTDDLREVIRKNGRGEIYMDSLELHTFGAGGLLWGYDLTGEFFRRKGYDAVPYLPFLTMDGIRITAKTPKQYDYMAGDAPGNDAVRRIRADFHSVLSDLYVENVLKPLQLWLHSLGMTLRAEPSYGMPYEISTPARYIDGIETESFAQVADIDLYRGILGSANLYGRVFSSETGAVHGKNYYYSMERWTQLCYLQFAGGVSRTVFHGYSAIEGSEADTRWPGHEGMYARFSERFNSRQPASRHYPGWTRMLARNQKLLRQGSPARDIAILRTDYAFINYGQPEGHKTFEDNHFMRGLPIFWRDLSLQRAGYTYDYFSPLLLLDEENVSWTGRELQPEGPAYRAVIVYQESIELPALRKLYDIAGSGLPVLFVNNNSEILAYDGTDIAHGKAASSSKYYQDSDDEIRRVAKEIKKLPNVAEVGSPREALAALEGLGVKPRVAFGEPNDKIVTISRRDTENGIFYTFAYSFHSATQKDAGAYPFTLEIEGEGIPYQVDDWSGEVRRIGLYSVGEGRTRLPLALVPGEACLIALDLRGSGLPHAISTTADGIVVTTGGVLSAVATRSGEYTTLLDNGNSVTGKAEVPASIPLPRWDIAVEDWNEGERVVAVEEKFGHVTREVYYTTKKTVLSFKDTVPVPWKDLPATKEQLALLAGEEPSMAHVSGIGAYTAGFTLPEDWGAMNGLCLEMESAGGGTVEVSVNGKKAPGVNIRTLKADISALVKPGKNEIRVEVASTLTNRMLQRGYRDMGSSWGEAVTAQEYGLTGGIWLRPYVRMPLTEKP